MQSGEWTEVKGEGFFGAIKSSITMFLVGLVCFPAAIIVSYCGEVSMVDHGKVIMQTESTEIASAPADGRWKFSGVPEMTALHPPGITDSVPVYYWERIFEEYIKPSGPCYETKKENGKEYKREIECKPGWERTNSDEDFVKAMKFSALTVKPSGTSIFRGDDETLRMEETKVRGATSHPAIGDKKVTTTGLPYQSGKTLFVIGDVASGIVSGGETFFISLFNESTTVKMLHGEYTTMKWVVRAIVFILFFVGFAGLVNPFLKIIDKIDNYIPFIGILAKIFYLVDAILSAVLTFLFTMFFAYWYVWLILAVLAIGFVIYRTVTGAKGAGEAPPTPPADAPAEG
jgi:hypothetical protein